MSNFVTPSVKSRCKYRLTRIKQFTTGKPALHFLHIGKTGGTAVIDVLRRHRVSGAYFIYDHPHFFKLSNVPEGEAAFFFVRDPMTRFISGFNSRLRQGRPRHDLPWSAAEKRTFSEFDTPNALALALSSPEEGKRQRAVAAMRTTMHIGDSYWFWFGDEAYLRSRWEDIFFVGSQEQLSNDFARFRELAGLPASAQLPSDELRSHKSPAEYDRSLDPEARVNLQRWYRRDFEFLEFCQDMSGRPLT